MTALLILGTIVGTIVVLMYPLIPVLLTFILICLIIVALIFSNTLILKYIKKGAPYVPSTDGAIKTIIEFAEIRPNTKITDLGSGDGKLAIALAKKGAAVEGFEINPLLIILSTIKARMLKQRNVKFYRRNFWRVNLSKYDVIVVYGIKYIMNDLEKKFKKELTPGTKVISNTFEFPTLKKIKEKNRIYYYEI